MTVTDTSNGGGQNRHESQGIPFRPIQNSQGSPGAARGGRFLNRPERNRRKISLWPARASCSKTCSCRCSVSCSPEIGRARASAESRKTAGRCSAQASLLLGASVEKVAEILARQPHRSQVGGEVHVRHVLVVCVDYDRTAATRLRPGTVT